MLSLTIKAPGGRKLELEVPATATFGDVKSKIAEGLGAPPDKQKLICSGKERKDGKETLAAAGVKGKATLMLMLAPGFSLPPAPEVAPADTGSTAPVEPSEASAALPADTYGVLPCPADVAANSDTEGKIHVRHGGRRYHITVPQGLGVATFGELATYVATSCLPDKVPPQELRFIRQGKTADGTQKLAADGSKDVSVMLLFFPNFHAASEGGKWLEDRLKELEEAEKGIESLRKKIDGNLFDAETAIKLGELGGLVETMKQSLESVKIRDSKLPAMELFTDRVNTADETIKDLRKRVRL